MTDAALDWTENGLDLEVEGSDLKLDDGLATAVLLSLFSDGRGEGSLLDGAEPRGWWAEDPPDRYGSSLWQLERAKTNPASVTAIEDAARLALSWLIDDGIGEALEVSALVPEFGRLELRVRIIRGAAAGEPALWAATAAYVLPFGAVLLSLDTA